MEPERPRFRYDLAFLVVLFFIGGLFWFFRLAGSRFAGLPTPAPERQSVSPQSSLELPPEAPLPPAEHPFFVQITPSEPKKTPQDGKKRPAVRKHKPEIPTRWEIINEY